MWLRKHTDTVAATPVLLDAIYDPWPTPLASAVEAAGDRVISGLEMLLNQANAQVEQQFTGLPAPKEAMWAALGNR
jgi:shikimate dehydrogenase